MSSPSTKNTSEMPMSDYTHYVMEFNIKDKKYKKMKIPTLDFGTYDEEYDGEYATDLNKITELSDQRELGWNSILIHHILEYKCKIVNKDWGLNFSAKLYRFLGDERKNCIKEYKNLRILLGTERGGFTPVYPAYILYEDNLKKYSTFHDPLCWEDYMGNIRYPPIVSPDSLVPAGSRKKFEKFGN